MISTPYGMMFIALCSSLISSLTYRYSLCLFERKTGVQFSSFKRDSMKVGQEVCMYGRTPSQDEDLRRPSAGNPVDTQGSCQAVVRQLSGSCQAVALVRRMGFRKIIGLSQLK